MTMTLILCRDKFLDVIHTYFIFAGFVVDNANIAVFKTVNTVNGSLDVVSYRTSER